MLEDRDAGREQGGVDRAPRVIRRVDVQAVDPHEHDSPVDEPPRGSLGQEGRLDAVGWRAEVAIPSAVEEDGPAADLDVGKDVDVDDTDVAGTDHDPSH